MLPSNTASYLQPQDASVIRQFKAMLAKRQTHHILDCLDTLMESAAAKGRECERRDLDKLYNVDVLTAVQRAQDAWESVTRTTIVNCWCHTHILDEEIYELVESAGRMCL